MVHLKFGIIFFPLIYASVLGNCNKGTKVTSDTTEEPYTLYIKTFVSACIEPVFFLNFSSACKGPFIAGKAKKYAPEVHFPWGRGAVECGTWPLPCGEIQELSSLKRHSLILRPVLRKSAVHIFIYVRIGSDGSQLVCVFFKSTSSILVNLQAVAILPVTD